MVGWQGIGAGFCGQMKQAVFHSIGVPCPYLCILCFAVDRPAHSTFCINSMFNKIGALLGRSFPLVKSVGVVDVGLDHSQAEPGPYSGSTVVPNVPLGPFKIIWPSLHSVQGFHLVALYGSYKPTPPQYHFHKVIIHCSYLPPTSATYRVLLLQSRLGGCKTLTHW